MYRNLLYQHYSVINLKRLNVKALITIGILLDPQPIPLKTVLKASGQIGIV